MKNLTKFALGTAGVFAVALSELAITNADAIGACNYREQANKDIVGKRSEADKKLFSDLDSVSESIKNLEDNEQKDISKFMSDWKEKHNYNGRLASIRDEMDDVIDEIKNDFELSTKEARIKDDAEEALNLWKERNNYDDSITRYKNDIKTAKAHYEEVKQKAKWITSDDDTYKRLKNFAKEARNKTVSDAEASIKSLEEKFDSERNRIYSSRDQSLTTTRNEYRKTIDDAKAPYLKEMRKIDNEYNEASQKFRTRQLEGRSDAESGLYEKKKQLKEATVAVEKAEKESVDKLVKSAKSPDRIAAYCKAHDVSTGEVLLVGSIPLAGIGTAAYFYTKGFVDVIRKLKK